MSLIDSINNDCVKARRDGKFSFTIQCSDWESVYKFMAAQARINIALSEQEEALEELGISP